jgi:hypothetical protein
MQFSAGVGIRSKLTIPTAQYLTKGACESSEPAASQPPDHSEKHRPATRSLNITQIFRRLCALFDGAGGTLAKVKVATSRYESCCDPSRAVIVLVRI